MSRNYDNWERLVAAVLRRELLWKLCHEQSRTPSLRSSLSSDFSSSFRSSASLDFEDPEDGLFESAQPLPLRTVAGIRTSVRLETRENSHRLVLFKGSPFAFSLEELLMAPSFVLGEELKTSMNTYVVSFKEGIIVVVKRLRRRNATHEAFKQWLKTIESIEHENVVRLRGYFFTEDERFGLYDYFHQGSLHTILHGKQGENRVHLDWEARMRIAIGAAKGLLHIHRQKGGKLVHGNIKASNVFLNFQEYGCIDIKSRASRISKYQPPEVWTTKKVSQASDVYSFGVLLIELVSERSPLHSTGRHGSFADWALHNARDEWTVLVFDKALLYHPLVKKAMWDVLEVALSCVREKPEERPKMNDVVEMLEFIYTYHIACLAISN